MSDPRHTGEIGMPGKEAELWSAKFGQPMSEPETPVERKHRKLRQNNQTRTFLNGRAKAMRRGRGRR